MRPNEPVRCLECREVYDPEDNAAGDVGCPNCGCVSWLAAAVLIGEQLHLEPPAGFAPA